MLASRNPMRLSGLVAVALIASTCAAPDGALFGEARPPAGAGGSTGNAADAGEDTAGTGGTEPPVGPATGHPRLWIRAADLDRLRSWATPANPMYASGLATAVSHAITTYETQFFPGGQPNPTWPDTGGDNWVSYATEAYAEIFAFMSLVDPDPAARAEHGARARNLLMHVMNAAAQGLDPSASPAPFRGAQFSTYNRASYWGEGFGLTVDWAYPYLTAADKATIQKVFLRWSNECLNGDVTAAEHPQPVGVTNDPALLADHEQLRWTANNYYTAHMRQLTLMSLALDPADDPPVDPSKPATALGNSVRSYLADVLGAWLYQQYAVYTDPATAAAALSVPATGLGIASGGLSAEGFLYGSSLGTLHEALLALHTAGYDDPALSGPQAALVQSPYWDRFIDGFLHSITPAAQTPTDPAYGYLGPVYGMAGYGDLIDFWIVPELVTAFATLGVLDQTTGNTTRLPALRWIAENAIQGGSGALLDRASNVWGNSYASQSILYYLLFDPAAPAPADPRPGRPLVFVDPALGRVLARTDWTSDATWFDYVCHWETINHQLGDCNQIDLWRKGEWLAKERSGYAVDFVGATSDYHDTLAVQNAVPDDLAWFEGPTSARGGQWTEGMSAGDPTVQVSSGAGWVYAYGDATNLYNRPGSSSDAASRAMDVAHVSRSVVWIEPDHVVVYDRATTKAAGRFKRFNLTLTASPTIVGHTATTISPGGQRLTLWNLLPAAATLTASPVESVQNVANLDPMRYRLVIEDPSRPTDVRFLDVLEAADGGAPVGNAKAVASASGTAFMGAAVAGAVVMFPVDPSAAFSGTSWVAPSGTSMQLVTGLTPGAGYTVSKQPGAGGVEVSVVAGGSVAADAAGVLVVP